MMNLIRLFLPAVHRRALDTATWRRIIALRRLFVVAWLVVLASVCGLAATYAPEFGYTPMFGFCNALLLSTAVLLKLNYYVLGGYKDMTWRDPALKLLTWLWGPTDKAWMAALDGALDEEFPHWREMEQTNPYEAKRFARNRELLAKRWLELKPEYSEDLAGDALSALKYTENRVGSGGLEVLFTYRDWQVAEDRKRDGLAFA